MYICISLNILLLLYYLAQQALLMGVCNATRETRASRLFCCKLSITPIVRANTIFQHIFILILNKKFRQNPKNSSKMKLKLIVLRGQGSSLETLRIRTAGRLRTAKSRKSVARDCAFPHFVIQLSWVFQPSFCVRSLLTLPCISNTKPT